MGTLKQQSPLGRGDDRMQFSRESLTADAIILSQSYQTHVVEEACTAQIRALGKLTSKKRLPFTAQQYYK